MNDWTQQTVDIFFHGDLPKLTGRLLSQLPYGVVIDIGTDGTAISHAIVQTFVPYASIRHMHRLAPRSAEEQEKKKHELNEKFRRTMMESLNAPSQQVIDTLQEEID
ncbi:MAG: hypothetical protein AB7K09_12170 [Planctomycetota bacterium]